MRPNKQAGSNLVDRHTVVVFPHQHHRTGDAGDHLNREFHFGLISATRMPVVSKTLENMWVIMGPLLSKFHAEVPKRELQSANHRHFEVLEGLRAQDSNKTKAALQADIAWGEVMIDWLEKKESLAEA